ncbi:MAG: putative flippase AglR [Methanoregulaceae archaeon PtaU1.Bin059]|nr:MAG: putative flippase AglR [Methanoregulaceae archaeon PtaB.Bin152]OPY43801.1 MAG: putative flippase AglR [Methanoregulaceae archaeon PtaU1.Bin059]
MQINPIQRQSLISFSTLIALTVIGYLSTMYFAHVLGPAILGSYFLFLAYYGIFDLIGDGGFGGAMVKRISEGTEQDQYFSAFIIMRLLLLVLSVTILFLAFPYIKDITSSGLFWWLILALIIGTVASFATNGIYSTGKAGISQISSFLNTVIKIIVQVIATFLGYALAGLVGGFIVGMVAGLLINLRFLTLHITRFTRQHLKSLFSFSFWIFLASSGSMVFAYADTILIGYFLSSADVGIYRVAFQLTGAAAFTTGSLHYVLYPRISNWHATGNLQKAESALSRGFTYSLLLAFPVVAGGIVLGDRLLYYLYGSAFETGTTALYILLLVQVANIFMFLQTMCLNAIDQPRKSFIVTAIAAVLNILLNVALIPLFGITGAAIATLGSITLNAILSYLYLSRAMQVRLEHLPVLHITASTIVMALAVILFRFAFGLGTVLHLAAAVTIGGVLYFLVLFSIDKGIKDDIRSIMATVGIPWQVLS